MTIVGRVRVVYDGGGLAPHVVNGEILSITPELLRFQVPEGKVIWIPIHRIYEITEVSNG